MPVSGVAVFAAAMGRMHKSFRSLVGCTGVRQGVTYELGNDPDSV